MYTILFSNIIYLLFEKKQFLILRKNNDKQSYRELQWTF